MPWRRDARCAEQVERLTGSHHDGPDRELIRQQNGETMAAADVPHYSEMLWPTLQAVAELGGSASIGEIVETVIKREGFSNAQQAVLHNNGPETEIGYRLAWGRTALKRAGLLTNSTRGVWALTGEGTAMVADRSVTDEQRRERVREKWSGYLAGLRQARKARPSDDDSGPEPYEPAAERSWKERLLDQLMTMRPDAFERLAQRLLREADFDSVKVTGQSGDGGIDGRGVYRLGLVSFPVFFQCKRYRGSVGAGTVRDFRGAMAGLGDKGLLITTGSFTAEAKKEATRDGVPAIDLIDGDRLCELLKRYDLGVQTAARTVEDVTIIGSFFAEI
jgi:restriction system protein